MEARTANNIKLGFFVLAGLFVLILAFYLVGKNRSLFGSSFELKARFQNLNGLIEGSNVLYAGIQAGTVKQIDILNDTTIEVVMMINKQTRPFIHRNASTSIGTEGLMGDKVIKITPGRGNSPNVKSGDLLKSQKLVNTDEMLQTLSKTNANLADISEALKKTVSRINNSEFWTLLDDKSIQRNLRYSLINIRKTTATAGEMTKSLNLIISQTQKGGGAMGKLLTDTAFAANLNAAMVNLKVATLNTSRLTRQLDDITTTVNGDLTKGKGLLQTLLRDSSTANNFSSAINNIRKGTDGFNQNMEALKHNFLLRGYFNKQEKEQNKKAKEKAR